MSLERAVRVYLGSGGVVPLSEMGQAHVAAFEAAVELLGDAVSVEALIEETAPVLAALKEDRRAAPGAERYDDFKAWWAGLSAHGKTAFCMLAGTTAESVRVTICTNKPLPFRVAALAPVPLSVTRPTLDRAIEDAAYKLRVPRDRYQAALLLLCGEV